jgi:hypothetical protein
MYATKKTKLTDNTPIASPVAEFVSYESIVENGGYQRLL